MQKFPWNKSTERAAQLIAEGRLEFPEIARLVGITRNTLYRWRKHPEFAAHVDRVIAEMRAEVGAEVKRFAIMDVMNRVGAQNDRWNRMTRVIEERAADPSMAKVPGGKTGLLVRTIKGIGTGKSYKVVEEYAVEIGLLKELREIEKHAAQELGQWTEKQEISASVSSTYEDDLAKAYGEEAARCDP